MIALFNFNSYLGGGETLFVRWGEWLQKRGEDYLLFYAENSYIEKDLARLNIATKHLRPVKGDINYYYLNNNKRRVLIEELLAGIGNIQEITLVSFCARDLYTLVDLIRNHNNFKLAHLVLHYQDNLYTCQTLWDKLLMKFKNQRHFSRKASLDFNTLLLDSLCKESIVIPQSVLQAKLWNKKYSIHLDEKITVPLPVCDFSQISHKTPINNNKIIWVGRIVDFKIPALCAMVDFIGKNCTYTLSIVGDGDEAFLKRYIKDKGYNSELFRFVGKVNYSDLHKIIKEHSIGYAMGTSIVEIGKYGVPVIMALASPDYQLFERPICGGLYLDISKGNVGDNLYFKGATDPVVLIDDAMNKLMGDFENMSEMSYRCIKENFDSEINFKLYMKYLHDAKHIEANFKIPQSSFIRKIAHRLFG